MSTGSQLALIARRFLIPRSFVTLYGVLRWRANFSPRHRYRSLDVPVDEQGVTSIGVRIGRNVWVGAKSLPMASGQSECDERLRVRRLAAVDRARARGDDRHILLAVGAEIGDRHRVRAEL